MSEADRRKWDGKYGAGLRGDLAAPPWLDELRGELPDGGPALDVAAGRGRVALWLATRGFAATALDISAVGLAAAADDAAARGLALDTVCADLEVDALPDGPFAVITCFRYRQPSLWPALRRRLAPGGALVVEVATVRNLERHEKPPARFLLEPNELLDAAAGLFVAYYREGWLGGFHLARLVARRGPA